jgi:hypothetical protein
VCAVGLALGGGFSPAVGLVPASSVLLGVAHAVVGWGQGRWDDIRPLKRIWLSAAASAGFVLGWVAIFALGVENAWTGSRTHALVWALPTIGCLGGLGAAMAGQRRK